MIRHRCFHSLLMAGCACLGLICTSITFAQQNEAQAPRSDGEQQERATQRQGRQGQAQGRQRQAELPQFLQKLDLSSEQETQIKQALQQHNQKLRRTWRQFHTKHAQAIELEAAWAAAVRDSLSSEDQRKFDQQRMQDRETSNRSRRDATQRRGTAAGRQGEARNRPRRERDGSAERESSERGDSDRREDQAAANQRRDRDEGRANDQADDAEGPEAVGLIVITTASPERFLEGTSQSSEQKQQCAKACREYNQKLTGVWSDLHRLHHDLVKIEADRIQAIEEQLTEDQLDQLKDDRQEPQDNQASTLQRSR